jgi:tripartite-type tricarboxylate transporter receptor subunit TctC
MKTARVVRRSIIFVSIAMLVLSFAAQSRSEYPERPVTIIVTMDPGGVTDLATRALTINMEKSLGKSLIVENRGGGGGAVGLGVLVNAKPDGYTLATTQNLSIVDTPLMQKVPYKPLSSFTPIAVFGYSEHTAVLVKPDAPWKTFGEFVDYAKKNPGKVKYSSAGVGSGMHVAMEYVAHKEGIKWVHVPFKGTAPSRTAVLGGHVDACSSGMGWAPFVLSGQLRVLATQGRNRSPQFPNAPTFKELGYEFVSEAYHTMVGPAGLPPDVVKKLENAAQRAMAAPEFKQTADAQEVTIFYMDSAQYDRHLKEKWSRTEKDFKMMGIIKEAATQPN